MILGRSNEFTEKAFWQALASTANVLSEGVGREAVVTLAEHEVSGPFPRLAGPSCRPHSGRGQYGFDLHAAGGRAGEKRPHGAGSVMLVVPQALTSELNTALRQGLAVAEGIALAKDVGNLPGNICTPIYLARKAEEMGEEYGFDVQVLERDEIADLGMGAFLAVGGATANGSRLIVTRYTSRRSRERPIVLVGQGVTFRAGGLPWRTNAEPEEARFDVSGAGSVLGVMRTAAKLRLKLNLVGILAVAETATGDGASRPGNVVTSMSGRTIEILDIGGEARLLLCDALTYAERFEPDCVIDVGTFTGACVVALGTHASGLFVNDDELGGGARAMRWRIRRPGLAAAALGRVSAAAGKPARRRCQPDGMRRRSDLGRVLPRPVHEGLSLGASRHRGNGIGLGLLEGFNRPPRAPLDRVPLAARHGRRDDPPLPTFFQSKEQAMSDLVFIAFPTEQKAEEVRTKILSLQKEYLIELGDAVVVVKDRAVTSGSTS